MPTGTRTPRTFRAALAALALAVTSAAACFWDSDTLRAEARGLQGAAPAIVGAFETYPPEYYERRIEIARARLADLTPPPLPGASPGPRYAVSEVVKLEALDNIAVSADRLGRADEALEALAQKRARLDALAAAGTPNTEHEYRYHANLGTVLAHRWLRGGADPISTDDLVAAREHIARAIAINPDAHFGREKYQLAILDWLIKPHPAAAADAESAPNAPTFLTNALPGLANLEYWADPDEESAVDDAINGLIGLVVLGDAWQSVDIFATLADLFDARSHSSLAVLARAHAVALLDSGRVSLGPATGSEVLRARLREEPTNSNGIDGQDFHDVITWYHSARASADAWRIAQHDLVRTRLLAGHHPDLDLAAFGDLGTASLPPLPDGVYGMTYLHAGHATAIFVTLVVVLLIAAGVFAGFIWLIIRICCRPSVAKAAARSAARPGPRSAARSPTA